MKTFLLIVNLLFAPLIYCQSLPFDFESDITTSDFVDFDGGMATVISNPQATGINTSNMVAQIIRNGGAIWAGSKIILDSNLDFTELNNISLKLFSSAPIGSQMKLKLEGNGAIERDTWTTTTGEWETLTWDFTGTSLNFNEIVFMFDFGINGDGSSTSTFLFDDVEMFNGGKQIDLPVDFEDDDTNYTLTDFEGASSMLTIDPTDPDNNVVMVVKGAGAGAYSGTTIGTNGGFASNIPLSLSDSKMNVRVWSPEKNTPIRLKVEKANDPTQTCETQVNTSKDGEWETLEFDFVNEANGTAKLEFGLNNGWTYSKASIFFNFGSEGSIQNEKTYYFDDVKFGSILSSTTIVLNNSIQIGPNPSSNNWTVQSDNKISEIRILDINGMNISTLKVNNNNYVINGQTISPGIYFASIKTKAGIEIKKIIKQ
jgi:hypothetical protein